MKKKSLLFSATIVSMVLLLPECKKTTDQDKQLFDLAKTTAGYTYYKGDNTIQPSSPQSAHNAYFRVRFNDIAQAALTDNGKLPAGSSFPEGSVVVKELYDSPTGDLKLLAIMQKASGNSASGVNWLWAEYKPDGKLGYSTAKKGEGCISCHSSAGNRDYVRLFELFP